MTDLSPKEIHEAIRKAFHFLVASHGYAEAQAPQSAFETYSEVQYLKHRWVISVRTTGHGTMISLRIISPDGQNGFLSHLFNPKTTKALRAMQTSDIRGDILYAAHCLKTHGSALLVGGTKDFESILALVQDRHKAWHLKNNIVSEDDMTRIEELANKAL